VCGGPPFCGPFFLRDWTFSFAESWFRCVYSSCDRANDARDRCAKPRRVLAPSTNTRVALSCRQNKRAPVAMHASATMQVLCLLAAALCLLPAAAEVFTPPSPLLVNAFAGANESWFRYPEASSGSNYSMPSITSRPRFGIALSGGGMRAATLGLGYLRGIQQVQ
jgi:hypothetical protein